eukprot:s6808_g1.t1
MLRKETLKELFMPIFESLLHPNDEVVITALRVLAQIMEAKPVEEELCIEDLLPEEEGSASASSSTGSGGSRSDLFTVIVHRLLREFSTHQEMLESRGRLMIRQVCGYLDPQRLYVTVARAIQQEKDRAFAQKLVQTFSWILLTAVETRGLREDRLGPDAKSDLPRPLFLELLEPWFHNPTSALALCLWAQQYELASELTGRYFGPVGLGFGDYVCPIFVYVGYRTVRLRSDPEQTCLRLQQDIVKARQRVGLRTITSQVAEEDHAGTGGAESTVNVPGSQAGTLLAYFKNSKK